MNPSQGQEFLHNIHLASVTVGTPHASNGCDYRWFTMPDVTADQDIASSGAASTAYSVTATRTVTMSDGNGTIPVNQDACQGATISFGFTTD